MARGIRLSLAALVVGLLGSQASAQGIPGVMDPFGYYGGGGGGFGYGSYYGNPYGGTYTGMSMGGGSFVMTPGGGWRYSAPYHPRFHGYYGRYSPSPQLHPTPSRLPR